ncbi:ATP-grasp fold amidoligase family protein [Oceanobacillus caeni]
MQESEQLEKQFEHEMEKEYSFLRTLMEIELKIENLDQKVKKNVKEKRNIKKSHSWRYSKPLRMFHASENHYNLDLQADIYHLKEELRYLSLQIERQDPEQMFGYLKEAKKSGEIFQHLESLLKQKLESDTFYSAIFKYIASLYKNEKAEYRDLVYNKLLSGMSTDHVPEMIVRAGEGCDSLSLKQVASFQTSLNLRARRGQLGDSLPEKLLDKKEVAYRFVDKLGVRRPWTGNDTFPSDKIPKKKGIVIKPVDGAGSRGVYLVLDFTKIIDLKRQKTLKNWEMLEESMKEDITSGWVKQDEWLMEELIYDGNSLATDLKFYCFYGEVGLILEITRVPELKYCWWSAKGKRIRTGKYDEDLYKGQGVTEQEIKLASDISTQIPAPFVRVDFLRSANGLVFGEFTPKPGNYDEFDKKTDQLLGDYYLEAESRLTEDLLEGKQFKPYTEIKKRFHL